MRIIYEVQEHYYKLMICSGSAWTIMETKQSDNFFFFNYIYPLLMHTYFHLQEKEDKS